jgi:hypothetical protein
MHRALGSTLLFQRHYARVGIWLDPSDVRRLM